MYLLMNYDLFIITKKYCEASFFSDEKGLIKQ